MEEIPRQIVPNPLVSWGVVIASLGAIEDNLREAKPQLGFKNAHVGVNFPYVEQTFPAIVVGLNGLRVENAGFYSAELTEPRNQLIFSYGNVSVEVYTSNHNTLMTIVDFISQCYLMNMYERHKLFYPGTEKSWVAMGYSGGVIEWSPFKTVPQTHTNAQYESLFSASTNLQFKAEHHLSTNLAVVSAIDIEATALDRTV